MERLKKVSPSDANLLNQLLNNPYQIQEFGEFVSFMKIIGLQNHQIYTKLDNIFKMTLPKYFSNSNSVEKLKNAAKNQNVAYYVGVGALVLGFLSIYSDFVQKNNNEWLPFMIDVIGIILGLVI